MKTMPDDVRKICIQIVCGHERRVKEYYDRRREIIEGSPSRYEVIKSEDDPQNWEQSMYYYPPSGSRASRSGEEKALRLIALEKLTETKRMRAVEAAQRGVGLDLPENMRCKLVSAIMLNCKQGRKYPYEYLDVEGIGRSDFYERRTKFLFDLAVRLGLV